MGKGRQGKLTELLKWFEDLLCCYSFPRQSEGQHRRLYVHIQCMLQMMLTMIEVDFRVSFSSCSIDIALMASTLV